MSTAFRLALPLSIWLLAASGAPAETCATSASCSFGSCSHSKPCSGICSCHSGCSSAGVYCYCHCFQLELEHEFSAVATAAPVDRSLNGRAFDIGGTINLSSLAVMINDLMWGVSMDAGAKGEPVLSGSYSGSLTEILEDIAYDSGFSVSWDDNDHVVTLSVD